MPVGALHADTVQGIAPLPDLAGDHLRELPMQLGLPKDAPYRLNAGLLQILCLPIVLPSGTPGTGLDLVAFRYLAGRSGYSVPAPL